MHTDASNSAPFGLLITATNGVVDDGHASYMDGQTRPVSLTPDGALRVVTANESYTFASWGTNAGISVNYSQNATISW